MSEDFEEPEDKDEIYFSRNPSKTSFYNNNQKDLNINDTMEKLNNGNLNIGESKCFFKL